jgi:hypothetical protein
MPPVRRKNPSVEPPAWGECAIAVLVAVGVASALQTPFAPWYVMTHELSNYSVENVTFDLEVKSTLYPGSQWRYYCSASDSAPAWNEFCARTWTHPNGMAQSYDCFATPCGANDELGFLYALVWNLSWIVLLAGIASLGGLFLLLNGRGGWRLRTTVGLVLAATALVSLGLVLGVAVLQPTAVAHASSISPNYGGPSSTFWGTCGPATTCEGTFTGPNGTSAITTAQWGPSSGWFLELTAGVLFLVAGFATFRTGIIRRRAPRGLAPIPPGGQ